MNSNDYINKCIASLPKEKQELARQAFERLGEGADSGDLISSLLIIFEATAVYAETIPLQITAERQALHEVFESHRKQVIEDQEKLEQVLGAKMRQNIQNQFPILAQQLRLEDLKEEISAQSAVVGRINRSIERLREWRMARLIFLMALSLLGGVWTTHTYHEKQREQDTLTIAAAEQSLKFVNDLNAAGLRFQLHYFNNQTQLIITGPPIIQGTQLHKDAHGIANRVELIFKRNRNTP